MAQDSLDSRVAAPPRRLRALARIDGAVVLGQSVHCISCGSEDGFVPIGLPPGVVYICGDCEGTYGVPPQLLARPDLDEQRVS